MKPVVKTNESGIDSCLQPFQSYLQHHTLEKLTHARKYQNISSTPPPQRKK